LFYDLITEIEENLGEKASKETFVCISDNILASIMGLDLGFYSFDFVVEKTGNIIFFDV